MSRLILRDMNRIVVIIMALLCVPAFSKIVQACQCREYGTPICARYWRSDAVFFGEVVDIKPLKKKPVSVYTYLMVRFTVQEAFRGISGPRAEVATATTMCDTEFKKGKRYLVYASLDSETNQFFTGMCTGTGLANETDESLKDLRKLARREADESITGRIVTNRFQGLAGLTVEVTGNEKTFKTATTKDGRFSISLPNSGFYKVRVSVPYLARLMLHSYDVAVKATEANSVSTFEYDVTLEKGECSYLELDLDGTDPRATAMVAGTVLTAEEQAVDKGVVSLVNAVDTGPDYIERLKKDGSFRFESVAPGDYHVVLNAVSEVPDDFDAPYARTYYPAATDKREAKVIRVTEGATIENIHLRVGPRMSERKVTGTVRWKSGRSLEDAYIKVYSGNEYVRRVQIKEDGTFNFILYGDFEYSIEAVDFSDEIEGLSQRIKVPQGDSAKLKLIIQRIKR